MIRRSGILAASALLLLGAVQADAQRRGMPGGQGFGVSAMANPSAVVSAELAFARLAQDKGQWTAFRETADKDAVMFVPDAVNAQAWLKKQVDPSKAVTWKPYRVFVSCDGGYALSTGPWTDADGKTGTFSTIWRRQKKGDFKWVVDFGSDTRLAAQDDPIIEGKVADCPARGAGRGDVQRGKPPKMEIVRIPIPPPPSGEGQSEDGSLRWTWTKGESGQVFDVTMRYQGQQQSILRETAPVAKP